MNTRPLRPALLKALLLAFALCQLWPAFAQAQDALASQSRVEPRYPARLSALASNADRLSAEVAVDLRGAPMQAALQAVTDQVGLRLMYGTDRLADQPPVTLRLERATALEALHEIIRDTDLGLKISSFGLLMVVDRPRDVAPPTAPAMELVILHGVSGRVVGAEEGEPLPGVNVQVKGELIGTTTGVDGFYALETPTPDDTLVFSFVGFETQEVPIAGRAEVNVILEPATELLEEVVVIGYGEKSRALLTESIGTLEADEIREIPVASPDQALQGRVSGVQVTSVDGTPGSPVAIRVRGVGTVGNAQPLFVIDGVPVGRSSSDLTNPLATINPSDIENISVLKDASAAAVYGVRAANGVVLITTRRGQLGKPTIAFDAYYGVQRFPNLWEMNTTSEYVALTQDAYDNYNQQLGLTPDDDSYLTLHPDLQAGSRYLGINNSEAWIEDASNENAPIQNYNLSVSGATDELNYFVSAGYFGQDALIDKWNLDRLTFRANSDFSITPRIRFGETFSVSYQEVFRGVNAGGDGYLLRNAARMPPFFEIYDTDGSVPGNRYGYEGNADVAGLTIGNQNGINAIRDNTDRDIRLLGGLHGEVDLWRGFRFRTAASLDLTMGRADNWNPGYTVQELGLDRNVQQYGDNRSEAYTQVFTNTLNYANTFGRHSFDILAGTEYQRLRATTLGGNAETFLSADPNFYRVVKNGSENVRLGGGASESAFLSYLGRVSYDYGNRYLLTATLRRDGSSRFDPGERWGTFPSVSAAWRVSEEPFFSVPAVSAFKLRGSWGQLGNDLTTAFPHVFRVSVTPDYGLGGETTVQAPAPINFVNEDVTWETVETFDLGLDLGFFNDRLDLLATYYRRTTKDFLINIPIPSVTGFTIAPVNAGSVRNSGFEFEVGYSALLFDEVALNASANLTTVNNELTELAPGINEFVEGGGYRTAVGFPIGYLYGYETDGLFQTPEEAAAALEDRLSQGAAPGDVRFVDLGRPCTDADRESGACAPGQTSLDEADGLIDPNDRAYLGKTIPDAYYGLNLDATYKRFDIAVFFQGVAGIQLYNQFRSASENLTGSGSNLLATTQDRWTGPGTGDEMPRAVATDPNANNRFSDRWIENADYFRLKNLQVGYTLPASLVQTGNTARIYVAATNLLTFTPYTGLDPEVMTYGSDASQLRAGTDVGNIPQPRTYRVGFQLQF